MNFIRYHLGYWVTTAFLVLVVVVAILSGVAAYEQRKSPAPVIRDVRSLTLTDAARAEVLLVRGLSTTFPEGAIAFARPARPTAAEVILTTADGREWRAQWELKP